MITSVPRKRGEQSREKKEQGRQLPDLAVGGWKDRGTGGLAFSLGVIVRAARAKSELSADCFEISGVNEQYLRL